MALPNPVELPVSDVDFTWDQIVDMVDDYFEIAREQRVTEIEGVLMEGTIVTKPKVGAVGDDFLLGDAGWRYERLHSTLQSLRRQARLRVIPAGVGFRVHVEVHKELEDVSQPEYSTVTSSVQRHDGSLVTSDLTDRRMGPATLGWIQLGRDTALEQAMLRNLHARLHSVTEAY